MPNFNIGLSALRTSQYALDLVSNNVANANTEGYHRQKVHMEALPSNHSSGLRIGTGVSVHYIERVRSRITETSLTNSISDEQHALQLVEVERQIEQAFVTGDSSITSEIDSLFSELTKLTAYPDEPAQRAAVLETTERLTSFTRQSATRLLELKTSIRAQLDQEVSVLNNDMELLSEISAKITTLSTQNLPPNSELDRRDALLNKVAETIGVSRRENFTNEVNLTFGNASIQQTGTPHRFRVEEIDGELQVLLDDSDRAIDAQSGRIAALVALHNTTIPKYEARLDEFASELIHAFDSAHAVGIGNSGPFSHLVGGRRVESHTAPLTESGAAFPIQRGDLAITITDRDGQQRTDVIAIDPDVDSLNDVADKISNIPGLSASVKTDTGQLQIFSESGISFDFTGNLTTQPDLSATTATTQAELSGRYTGSENDDVRFEFVGSGEIGITPDLQLNVYSQSGDLKGQYNIGHGYSAGTQIDLGDGVEISFGRGNVSDGESFSTRFTSTPDETGFLAAMGLNSLFDGDTASTIQLSSALVDDPGRFAAGKTPDSADTFNLLEMLQLEDDRDLPRGLTFAEYANDISTEIGFQIRSDESLHASLYSIQIQLQQERDAVSGVDLNEELVYLQQFQKSYEAAVRVIQVTDQILDELFTIIR